MESGCGSVVGWRVGRGLRGWGIGMGEGWGRDGDGDRDEDVRVLKLGARSQLFEHKGTVPLSIAKKLLRIASTPLPNLRLTLLRPGIDR